MKIKVDNLFVMSATNEQLAVLAAFVGMNDAQVAKATKKGVLRAIIGTKLANEPHAAAFAASALEVEFPDATDQQAPHVDPQPAAGKRSATKSAKDWLRELMSEDGKEFTLAELIALTGKTEVNIRTMLSDLRSAKYCGKGGVFNTKSVRRDSKVYYSKA